MNDLITKICGFLFKINRRKLLPLSDRMYLRIAYHYLMKEKLNLKRPKTFNEKMQWLKLYDRNPNYSLMVDKYEIKKIVSRKLGKEYIIPTLGVYDTFDEINFDILPEKFIIKCTHDSGSSLLVNKGNFDIEKCKNFFNQALNNNYFKTGREYPYKNIKPRILIEEYLEVDNLIDYKFYCYNGNPKYCFIAFGKAHSNERVSQFLNIDFTPADIIRTDITVNKRKLKKPLNYSKMIEISKLLSKNIPFARVDLYNVEGKIKFGEITFYPGSGFIPFLNKKMDLELGKSILLKKYGRKSNENNK